MARKMGHLLDGYPTWSQNADPMPDGTLDPFHSTDCGEECCSIVMYGLAKVYTTAGQVRAEMPGHSDHGETTPKDLSNYLEKQGLYPLVLHKSPASLRAGIKVGVGVGSPSIVLGHFLSPNVLHWVVVVGYGNDHAVYIDPWYGRMEAMHWVPFLGLTTGDIVVARTRSQAT